MPNNNKVYLVTGANVGLGKETVRQLALLPGTRRVYLACRSKDKAETAMEELVMEHGVDRNRLAFVRFDASESQTEIRRAVESTAWLAQDDDDDDDGIDGLVLNAGGWGHDLSFRPVRPNGVLNIVQINLLGHLHLLEALSDRLHRKCRIVYSGTEGARGILCIVPTPTFVPTVDAVQEQLVSCRNLMSSYTTTKGLAALYFAALSRQRREWHTLVVSPGGTMGTAIMDQAGAPLFLRIFPSLLKVLIELLGIVHSVEVGAKRYVDAVVGNWNDRFESGTFVASTRLVTGQVCDQSTLSCGRQYGDKKLQDVVYRVLQKYVMRSPS